MASRSTGFVYDHSTWFTNDAFIAGAACHLSAAILLALVPPVLGNKQRRRARRWVPWVDLLLTLIGWAFVVLSMTHETVVCYDALTLLLPFSVAMAVVAYMAQFARRHAFVSYQDPWTTTFVFIGDVISFALFASALAVGKSFPLSALAVGFGSVLPISVAMWAQAAMQQGVICCGISQRWVFRVVPALSTMAGWVFLSLVACKTCR